jgi:nucleoside phosphorylase
MPDSATRIAVILTALEVETRAVLRHLSTWSDETVEGTVFYCGEFAGWRIAVAEIGPGNASAAAVGQRALSRFKPEVALFVGIAGGIKDVEIGDVAVATKVHGYESGKEDDRGFSPRPDVMNAAHAIEQCARAIRLREDWRRRLNSLIDHGKPNIVVAPIAAGEKVVATARKQVATLLKNNYGDAVAVEMEGRGFLEGVHLNRSVEGGVIRGISDLLDGKAEADRAGSQARAAGAASAVAFELLARLSEGAEIKRPSDQDRQFTAMRSTFTRAAFFQQSEVLAQVGVPGVDQVSFSYAGSPDGYIRIMPSHNLTQPLRLAVLNQVSGRASILRAKGFGGLSAVNKYGVIHYDPGGAFPGGAAPLHWATQLFSNGETWLTTDTITVRERGFRPAWLPLPFIPALVMEKTFYNSLHAAIPFARDQLGLAEPLQVELGLIGIKGAHLNFPKEEDALRPIHRNEIIIGPELIDGSPESADELLLEFFRQVFDATGFARPEGLHNFPPGPPDA